MTTQTIGHTLVVDVDQLMSDGRARTAADVCRALRLPIEEYREVRLLLCDGYRRLSVDETTAIGRKATAKVYRAEPVEPNE